MGLCSFRHCDDKGSPSSLTGAFGLMLDWLDCVRAGQEVRISSGVINSIIVLLYLGTPIAASDQCFQKGVFFLPKTHRTGMAPTTSFPLLLYLFQLFSYCISSKSDLGRHTRPLPSSKLEHNLTASNPISSPPCHMESRSGSGFEALIP